VAILGRPNVGKSTLFNALIGRRRAITHSDPGVTRDSVEAETLFSGRRILLIDTGGYRVERDEMDELVAAKSLQAARNADLALLVLDATETNAEDETYIEKLRALEEKLILVVNKVDTPDRESLVWNFHSYGFPHVVGVSAAHRRSLEDLKELVVRLLGPEAAGEAPQGEGAALTGDAVRVAVLGKPNSGKSSLSNLLLGEDKSIVSSMPGTTRDVVEGRFTYRGRTFRLLDTAGIRRKSRVKDSIEYYSVSRALESVREADVVLLLVDSAEGLSDQDKKIAAYAVDQGRGIVLVMSKWDLVSGGKKSEEREAERIRFFFPVLHFAPIVPVSSLVKSGVKRLLETALELHEQLTRRVGTGRLNQSIQEWVTRYPLPVRGKNYKIRFATQVKVNPVRFVVFVNRIAGFPMAYTQYLENCIRRDLGFSKIPVAVEIRQSRKPPR
jgi:GTP-binding protein